MSETPVNIYDRGRLEALLEVANDITLRPEITPPWWASFGRECAHDVPLLLAEIDELRTRLMAADLVVADAREVMTHGPVSIGLASIARAEASRAAHYRLAFSLGAYAR